MCNDIVPLNTKKALIPKVILWTLQREGQSNLTMGDRAVKITLIGSPVAVSTPEMMQEIRGTVLNDELQHLQQASPRRGRTPLS